MLQYRLVRSPRRRRLAVKVERNGDIVAMAPPRLAQGLIEEFILRHRAWIEKQQRLIRERCELVPPKTFRPGERFLLLGGEYILTPGGGRGVKVAGECLLAPGDLSEPEAVRRALTAFYRRTAREQLAPRLSQWAEHHGLAVGKVRITGARSRWGSCSRGGDINLAWRLVQCPWELIDYVLAHELAHLSEMNHSPRFYAALEGLLPDWRRREQQLRREAWKYGSW